MEPIYAAHTASVTELRRQYVKLVKEAEGMPVAILNNNKPENYLVPARVYADLIKRLEDLEDALLVMQRQSDPTIEVSLDDLRNGDI